MEIKKNFLFLKTRIEIVECLNKVKQLLLKGIKTENLFLGKLFLAENGTITVQNDYKYFCHGVFVKLKSTKTGDYYFYFHKDSRYCKLLNENPKNYVNTNAWLKIQKPFDKVNKLDVSKGRINARLIKILNEKLEEYSIFGDLKEKDFDDDYIK